MSAFNGWFESDMVVSTGVHLKRRNGSTVFRKVQFYLQGKTEDTLRILGGSVVVPECSHCGSITHPLTIALGPEAPPKRPPPKKPATKKATAKKTGGKRHAS